MLYLDGAPAGFFDIKPHLPDEVELAYFGMMEHATGQGIGRWFLGAAIAAAGRTGRKRVTVQTCTLDHPAALPLYQKLGFSPVAQKQEMVHTADLRRALGQRHAALNATVDILPERPVHRSLQPSFGHGRSASVRCRSE